MGFGASRARRQRAMAHPWITFSIVEPPTKARSRLNRGNWLCAANGIEAASASPRELRVRRDPRAVSAVTHGHAGAYPHPRTLSGWAPHPARMLRGAYFVDDDVDDNSMMMKY